MYRTSSLINIETLHKHILNATWHYRRWMLIRHDFVHPFTWRAHKQTKHEQPQKPSIVLFRTDIPNITIPQKQLSQTCLRHNTVDAFELNAGTATATNSPVRFSRNFSLSSMMLPSSRRDSETSHQQLNQSSTTAAASASASASTARPTTTATASTSAGAAASAATSQPHVRSTDEAHNNVALIKIGEASALPVMLCGILQNKEQFYQQALHHQQQQQYFADLQNSPDYYSAYKFGHHLVPPPIDPHHCISNTNTTTHTQTHTAKYTS